MDETNRNSMKLDIEAVRLSENDRDYPKETYKQLSEFHLDDKSIGPVKNSNMVREKVDQTEDGADESMLGEEEKQKLARKDEVKFISGEHPNGDAKIDIGVIDKSFTGMTKEELMKYANDPFWVRLRWIFFILFWGLWIAMLIGAILIILRAPKCSAPRPLSWFKEGPLVQLPSTNVDPNVISQLKSINAKGVIFQLPANKTYLVDSPEVSQYVKNLVDQFKNTSINVILDLTPNYVAMDDELYKLALNNETYRSAFVWAENARQPTNWLSKVEEGENAWKKVEGKSNTFVLSQFGPYNVDLQLNDPIAKDRFKNVLRSLIKLGVKGFRLANAKHYIIDKGLGQEVASIIPNKVHTDYDFWTHTHTTFQTGIGELLHEFWKVVNNGTHGDGFLSVTENIVRPEVFSVKGNIFGFDIPIYKSLPFTLSANSTNLAKQLKDELKNLVVTLGNDTWVQWLFDRRAPDGQNIGVSEYNIFLFLLPGVPVGSLYDFIGTNGTNIKQIKELEAIRTSQSYQHGSFNVYTDQNDTVIAYTRIKSGNPGYFVAYNPLETSVAANFTAVANLPEQLTVYLVSDSYHEKDIVEKSKVPSNAIPLSGRSAIILTYVPKSSA